MSGDQLSVGIVGASGYTGGELLRLLHGHPAVVVTQVTANSSVGKFVHQVHPHLRGLFDLKFIPQESLQTCDILFLALPHNEAQHHINQFFELAMTIIDLSADFRLSSADDYAATYGQDHFAPEWLDRFVYGLPEVNRDALRRTRYASGVGCNATATTLAVMAVVRAGLLTPSQPIIVDLKVGSSEAGRTPTAASHHPARSGVVRPFQLTGHRHETEVRQVLAECGDFDVRMAVTSVEMVRGVSAAVHVTLPTGLEDKDFWKIYRQTWRDEAFVRIVHERSGLHQHPEPRLLAGTNYADVGWAYESATGRTVLLAALDNLGKGAAGTAVQCMNLMCGFEENTALTFGGIYP
jgi:N-acetyl-gamma-glutamyl-phosphate/LysW-gamma-L-alpha-aminoadipyl-6-phosphate reductase